MYRWRLETQHLPLKFTWKISRGQSTEKQLSFVHCETEGQNFTGEIAGITADPNKRKTLQEAFQKVQLLNPTEISQVLSLKLPSHLEFGVTSALTHLMAFKNNQSLSQFLKLPSIERVATSFSLPIMERQEMEGFFNTHQLQRFPVLKLKVSHQQSAESCLELARLYPGPLRIDANEAFSSAQQVLEFTQQIKHLNIQFIEEPLPRGSTEEYKNLKLKSPFPIFADESVQRDPLADDLREQFHGINVKLMKAGSYQRARQQIEQAKQWNMQVMLGCMVESSLGIGGALAIAADVDYFDLDGFLYFKEEPFGWVQEKAGNLRFSPNKADSPFLAPR